MCDEVVVVGCEVNCHVMYTRLGQANRRKAKRHQDHLLDVPMPHVYVLTIAGSNVSATYSSQNDELLYVQLRINYQ